MTDNQPTATAPELTLGEKEVIQYWARRLTPQGTSTDEVCEIAVRIGAHIFATCRTGKEQEAMLTAMRSVRKEESGIAAFLEDADAYYKNIQEGLRRP